MLTVSVLDLRMVPTTVERLREGHGVLERVLRSIKMERNYKTEKESGTKNWLTIIIINTVLAQI